MKIKTIFGLTLATVSLAACSVEEQTDSKTQLTEDYTREFIKEFGTINPNQDWNVVEQKSVTVSSSSPVDVLIYEQQDGTYKLAANYKDVSGSTTLAFDGLEGDDTPFIVSIDGNMVAAKNGETINYKASTASRAKRAPMLDGSSSLVTRASSPTQITLYENDNVFKNLQKNDGKDNTDGIVDVADQFLEVLEAGKGTTYYPMYWNSSNIHKVGLYYYDNNSSACIEVPIYKDHDSEDIMYCPGKNKDTEFYYSEGNDESTQFTNTKISGGKKKKWNSDYFQGYTFKSHAYTVKPTTKSIICGVYVEMSDGTKYYSDKDLNVDKTSHFATRTVGSGENAYTYLCFDDPADMATGGDGDKDYNDLVFYTPRTMNPVSHEDISWLVACEDLGGTFDYDFNDIVFRVYHVSGNDYLTVVPVAAGGTLEAYLLYNGKKISEEWHKHFGDGHEYTDMINTGGISETAVWPIRLTNLPTDWSMTTFTSASSDTANDANDGGFSIQVTRADGQKVSVTRPSKGTAPQMLVLPYSWQWPRELKRITLVYPDFGMWGENYTNSDWTSNKEEGEYINMSESNFTATKAPKVMSAE
jgi:hypothetical protein